jgi:hypothetical protein
LRESIKNCCLFSLHRNPHEGKLDSLPHRKPRCRRRW